MQLDDTVSESAICSTSVLFYASSEATQIMERTKIKQLTEALRLLKHRDYSEKDMDKFQYFMFALHPTKQELISWHSFF